MFIQIINNHGWIFTFLLHYFQRNKAVTSASQLTIVLIHFFSFFLFFFFLFPLLDRSYHKLPINMALRIHEYTQVTHFPSANYTRVHTHIGNRCTVVPFVHARLAREQCWRSPRERACIRATISHTRESKMSSERRRPMSLWIIKSTAANSYFRNAHFRLRT